MSFLPTYSPPVFTSSSLTTVWVNYLLLTCCIPDILFLFPPILFKYSNRISYTRSIFLSSTSLSCYSNCVLTVTASWGKNNSTRTSIGLFVERKPLYQLAIVWDLQRRMYWDLYSFDRIYSFGLFISYLSFFLS